MPRKKVDPLDAASLMLLGAFAYFLGTELSRLSQSRKARP